MGLKVSLTLLPNRDPGPVTIGTTVDDVGTNDIAIYYGDDVPTYRQLEIYDAWWQLWAGVRDRNIMQQFAGILYSGMDINNIGEADRRTISTIASFTTDDIILGMGATVCIDFHDATETIQSGYDKLIQAALEQVFKAA